MIYATTITAASLRVRESRLVAELLLQQVSSAEWHDAIIERNILQINSVSSADKVARLLRARLTPMGDGLWEMVKDGDRELATQACFAGAVKHSRLLGDFLDITLRQQRLLFEDELRPTQWTDYIEGCRGRDPDMPTWSDATVRKLRSAVFSMLAETGYVKDTRSLFLQNVFVLTQLSAYLRARNETYVLRCLEVSE